MRDGNQETAYAYGVGVWGGCGHSFKRCWCCCRCSIKCQLHPDPLSQRQKNTDGKWGWHYGASAGTACMALLTAGNQKVGGHEGMDSFPLRRI